ncbi:MAG: superoxide dismutase family protein, partial [Candidatus Zixiibacteriota bacterium]
MKIFVKLISALLVAASFSITPVFAQSHTESVHQANPPATIQKAIAVMHPTNGSSVSGKVTFTKVKSGIVINAYITGLTPGKHGFHIHEFGDCSSDDGTSTGGHFNPTQMPHGAPTDAQRHSGDFGNVTADSTGVASLEWLD